MPVSYNIGTGIGEVTDPAVGLPLQGMADKNQIATGVESPLYARAFVVAPPPSAGAGGCVVIIVADIWSGTRRVKDGVLERLAAAHESLYTEENVLLAGTLTHSAPGGFSGMLLYDFDFSRGGCDEATVTCIVDGCVRAVEMAHANVAPGRIYVNRGDVADCGQNRSRPAYLCNPQAERDHWGADTDREMREFTGPLLPTIDKLTVRVSDDIQPTMSAGQLLIISADGSISVDEYTPPPRE